MTIPAASPSDAPAAGLVQEPRVPPAMNILPNNLGEWAPGKPWRDSPPVATRTHSRAAARLVVLILVGGLLGIGAYRWAGSRDEAVSPAALSVTAPVQSDSSA